MQDEKKIKKYNAISFSCFPQVLLSFFLLCLFLVEVETNWVRSTHPMTQIGTMPLAVRGRWQLGGATISSYVLGTHTHTTSIVFSKILKV